MSRHRAGAAPGRQRRLIVNADDFGSSEAVNEAVVRAYTEGVLTSCSLMVTGAAFEHAVRLAHAHPGLAVGIHLVVHRNYLGHDWYTDRRPGFMFLSMNAIQDPRMALTTMVYDGVFERFPRLKIILTEVDASWIPHFLHRADHYFKRYSSGTGFSMIPSEYMRRNVWVTFQDEGENIPYAAALYGADRLLWASDFPHMNSTYPDTQKFIETSFPGMRPG